jgi:hypothetical protein
MGYGASGLLMQTTTPLESEVRRDGEWRGKEAQAAGRTEPEAKPGKKGWYSASTEFIHRNDEEQHKENAKCQRQYENAVQEAKLLYGSK